MRTILELLIRRHSELSATDWDTGILARFIAPPSHPLHTRRAAPPVGARYGNAGWDTSSRRALKQTVHKTAQKLLTHESMGVKMLAARCGAGRKLPDVGFRKVEGQRERDKQVGQIIDSGYLEWKWNGPAGCLSQKTGNDDAI
ncbi:hypothetical protein J6590_074597 [Homalodisca vitripennis]|nr:hypothetical protein J6590_074597 [Homalodisca vitripennis]